MATRLTADLILSSLHYINPCGDLELDLRQHGFDVIENLGAARNQFEAIDMSDNAVRLLGGFPPLPALTTLLVCNNKISALEPGLGRALPSLASLVLTNNDLPDLASLAPLAELAASLKRISLVGNPAARAPNYRLYLLYLVPKLQVIDFCKVTKAERLASRETYGLPGSADAVVHPTFDPNAPLPSVLPSTRPSGPSPDEKAAIDALLASVDSLDEINRIKVLAKTPRGRATLLESAAAAAAAAGAASSSAPPAADDDDDLD